MIVKALLLGFKGDFSAYSETKKDFYRYTYQLYTKMKNNKLGIKIDKLEAKTLSSFGKSISLFTDSVFKDFSSYDVVHNLDFAPIFPTLKGRSVMITTAHDFQFALEPEINPFATERYMLKEMIFEKVILDLCLKSVLSSDFIIAVSTLTRDDAIRLGFDKSKIFVVNHGVDSRFSKPIRHKDKDGKFFKIGYLGAIGPKKNLPFALKAFKSISDPKIAFDIWGTEYYKPPELESARKNKKIHIKGFAPDDKIVEIYDSFDVFVFPSLYEGFGIPIIEAQARGLPVIVYKKGKLPMETRKFCIEAEDPEDMAQIIQDIKDNGYDDKQRKKAMDYARSFTWEKTAEKTLNTYTKVVNGRG